MEIAVYEKPTCTTCRKLDKLFVAVLFALIGLTFTGCIGSDISSDRTDANLIQVVQTPNPSNQATPPEIWNVGYNVVNGLRIGSTYNELKDRLGNSISEKRFGENGCGAAKTVIQYEGIAFTMDDDGERNIVIFIEITSPDWEISPGVRTGFTIEQVRSKMGRNGMLKTGEETDSLSYADGDGSLIFHLQDGKVAKITRSLELC